MVLEGRVQGGKGSIHLEDGIVTAFDKKRNVLCSGPVEQVVLYHYDEKKPYFIFAVAGQPAVGYDGKMASWRAYGELIQAMLPHVEYKAMSRAGASKELFRSVGAQFKSLGAEIKEEWAEIDKKTAEKQAETNRKHEEKMAEIDEINAEREAEKKQQALEKQARREQLQKELDENEQKLAERAQRWQEKADQKEAERLEKIRQKSGGNLVKERVLANDGTPAFNPAAIKKANEMLADSETLVDAFQVNANMYPVLGKLKQDFWNFKNKEDGILVITNQRVYFVKSSWGNDSRKQIFLKDITSVEEHTSPVGFSSIRIQSVTEMLVVDMMRSILKTMRDALDKARMEGQSQNVVVVEQPTAEATKGNYIEELKELAALRESGIITDEEFEAKKKQLLRV